MCVCVWMDRNGFVGVFRLFVWFGFLWFIWERTFPVGVCVYKEIEMGLDEKS